MSVICSWSMIFSRYSGFLHQDIAEILLKVALSTVTSNSTHGEVYLIQHYVIKFVRSMVFTEYSVSSTNKTDRHDIIEILLKKVLNTIPPKVNYYLIESLVFKKSVCTCYKCTASLVCMMWYKNVINNNIIQFI